MSRRHRKLEPISLEAIETNPCITGLESVLRFNPPKTFELFPKRDADGHPIQASPPSSNAPGLDAPAYASGLDAPALNLPEIDAPALDAPALDAPALDHYALHDIETIIVINQGASNTGAPYQGAYNKGACNQGTSLLKAPLLGTPELGSPLAAPGSASPALEPDFVYRPPVKITPATSVQDGHTHGEQRVLDTLSRLAQPYQDARRIAIGIRSLARAVPMTYNNCLENVRSLIAKLAIEVVPSSKISAGQTYIIYGYTEILRRRRAAGLTHVIRRTKGVQLINSAAPALSAPNSNQGAPALGTSALNKGAPELGNPGAPLLEALSGISIRKEKTTTTVEDPAVSVIAAILREELGVVDNHAAVRIVSNCRAKAPAATLREFELLGRSRLRQWKTVRSIHNPVAMMITSLSRSFEGEAYQEFRQAELLYRRQEIRKWQQLLNDPEECEEAKQQAREQIAALENQ